MFLKTSIYAASVQLGLEPVALFTDITGGVLAATRSRDEAAVWRLGNGEWDKIVNLVEATAKALGDAAEALPEPEPDADGFVDVSETLIDQITLSETGVSWSVWNGDLLWQGFEADAPLVLKNTANATYAAVTASASGDLVADTESASSEILMFDTADGAMRAPISAPAPIETLDFDAGGTRLVAGLGNGQIAIADTDGGDWRVLPDQHSSPVAETLFLDGDRLLSHSTGGASDRNLVIHDLTRPDASLRIEARQPGGAATSVAYSAALDAIAVVDLDGTLHLWRASDRRFVQSLFFAGSYLSAVTFDAAGHRVIAADGGGAVRAWPLDPAVWTALVCEKAGRPLNLAEWNELMPDDDYAPACANGKP